MKYYQTLILKLSLLFRTKWKRQTAVGFELLAEAGNLAAVQNMCRGMGTFPWVPGYPPPHPATAHAAATASLFSSPAIQQQLDLYYRQVAATQAAAAAQALHQQKGPSSPNGSCPTNPIPPLQIPSPLHLHQPNLHYKLLPTMLPGVSSPLTPLSMSPSKPGISVQSSPPLPPHQDRTSPSPPPSVPLINAAQIPPEILPLSTSSNLDASNIPATALRPVSSIMPNSIGGMSTSTNSTSSSSSTMTSSVRAASTNKIKHRMSPPISFEIKCPTSKC